MKKAKGTCTAMLIAACALGMTACGNSGGVPGTVAFSEMEGKIKTPSMSFGSSEFSGYSFKLNDGWTTLSITHDGKSHEINGTPISGGFFSDINGDSKSELCCNLYYGSGIIDSRIVVYDIVNDQEYELSDREKYDYELYIEGNNLLARKKPYSSDKKGTSGSIAIENGQLVFVER